VRRLTPRFESAPLGTLTESTSLGSLAIRRAQLGIERLTFSYDPSSEWPVRVIAMAADGRRCMGTGQTEAQAIDDAFARLVHRIGADCMAEEGL